MDFRGSLVAKKESYLGLGGVCVKARNQVSLLGYLDEKSLKSMAR